MTKPTNVLLLNDNEADSESVVRELTAAGMNVTKASATTRDAAKEAITDVRPDVVLSDYSPERFSACDIVDVLRYERPETPLIVVSESVTGLAAVSCLRAGAEDIVIRKNVKRLPSAITTAIENYKESVSRSAILKIGDEAAASLRAGEQFAMDELLLWAEVDRIIIKRLRIPTYGTWRRKRLKLLEEYRRPEHWGIRPDGVLAREIHPPAESKVLVAGGDIDRTALYLAA